MHLPRVADPPRWPWYRACSSRRTRSSRWLEIPNLKMYHGENRIVAGVANNWLISAYTTYQSGGNLQALDNPNFSFSNSYTGTLPAGVGTSLTVATYFGTNTGISIQPKLTCSPLSGRGPKQFLTDKSPLPSRIATTTSAEWQRRTETTTRRWRTLRSRPHGTLPPRRLTTTGARPPTRLTTIGRPRAA